MHIFNICEEYIVALNKEAMLSTEYTSLRTEILQRISTRYTIINFALLLFAAALGFQKSFLVLLYPVIACFIMGMYVSNEHKKDELTKYIDLYIEDTVRVKNTGYYGWQHFKEYQDQQGLKDKFTGLHGWGRWLFFITEMVTLILALGIERPDFTQFFTILNIQYLIAIVFTIITVVLVFSPDRQLKTPPAQQDQTEKSAIVNPPPSAT
jgi:hypothetical protein